MDGIEFTVRIKGIRIAAWCVMIRGIGLVFDGNFVECLEFIHDVLFSELETAMCGVAEALLAFEENCE